jgi:hypothetical protein
MSSTRRILASRANGALSKGPKTPEGKLRCAGNAVKHGLRAHTVVPEDETSPAFAALVSEFEQDLQPRDLREQTCVQFMALARWRTLRLWRLEKDALEQEMARQDFEEHCPATRAAHAFRALCDGSRSAHLLIRYETMYSRQYERALNFLLEGRARKLEIFRTDLIPNSDTAPNNRRPA